MKSLEKEVRRLQEEHAARNADLTSQIAALTAEKAAVERRMAAQVRRCVHVLSAISTLGLSCWNDMPQYRVQQCVLSMICTC